VNESLAHFYAGIRLGFQGQKEGPIIANSKFQEELSLRERYTAAASQFKYTLGHPDCPLGCGVSWLHRNLNSPYNRRKRAEGCKDSTHKSSGEYGWGGQKSPIEMKIRAVILPLTNGG